MKSIKRMANSRRRSSYFRVSTKGSPTTSRSPSPTTSTNVTNASSTTAAAGSSSEEELDIRSTLEKKLFELVNSRKPQKVHNFLQTNRNVNINVRDTEGLSVLHLAVKNKDENMVEILLKDNFEIHIYDALLEAIKNNSIAIVHKILNWKESVRSKTEQVVKALFTRKKGQHLDGAEYYGDEITPLLMAATSGHYELIDLFYSKGERLPALHKPNCRCSECGRPSADLKKSNARLELLGAVCNASYMAYMAGVDKTFDPIFEAFELVKQLKMWIDIEPEFKDEYGKILMKIEKFPVQLLSHCRNSEETSILLKKEAGYSGISTPYPRLILAIDNGQKEFVANTNAQDVLYQEWIGQPWITTSPMERYIKDATLVLIAILYPIISIFLIFGVCCLKNARWVKLLISPSRRCWGSFFSYLYFLVILYIMNAQEKAPFNLGPPSHYLPWVVGFFVLSHFVAFLKHFFMSPRHFLTQGWNIFECFYYIFFFISFGLWIAVWDKDKRRAKKRQWLESDDILLWSEITTGVASTIAGLRLLGWCILNSTLGPMQITLGKVKGTIFLFAIIFGCIFVFFALGVQHLYRPYTKEGESCTFCDFPSALDALFYDLFSLTSVDSHKMPPVEFKKTDGSGTARNEYVFTEAVGQGIFVVHHILCVTFLLNMLTGIINNAYSSVRGEIAVEWKFAKAKLWLYYIQDGIIPPPFNIFPNSLFLLNFLSWGKALLSKTGRSRASCNIAQCCFLESEEKNETKKERDRRYPLLIRRLLQRHFRSQDFVESEDKPTNEVVAAVIKQVDELRALTTMSLELRSNPNSGTEITEESQTTGTSNKPQPPPSSNVST